MVSLKFKEVLCKASAELKRNKALLSFIATLGIIAILVLPAPAMAVSVSIKQLQGVKVVKGEEYAFNIDMGVEGSERVPIDMVRVATSGPTSFTYEFPAGGGTQTYLSLTPAFSFAPYWGYGYLYGYGYGYFPAVHPYGYGYGYYPTGYGYGYGYGTLPVTLKWNATLHTGGLNVGNYTMKVEVKSNNVWWGGDPTERSFYIVDYKVGVAPAAASLVQGGPQP